MRMKALYIFTVIACAAPIMARAADATIDDMINQLSQAVENVCAKNGKTVSGDKCVDKKTLSDTATDALKNLCKDKTACTTLLQCKDTEVCKTLLGTDETAPTVAADAVAKQYPDIKSKWTCESTGDKNVFDCTTEDDQKSYAVRVSFDANKKPTLSLITTTPKNLSNIVSVTDIKQKSGTLVERTETATPVQGCDQVSRNWDAAIKNATELCKKADEGRPIFNSQKNDLQNSIDLNDRSISAQKRDEMVEKLNKLINWINDINTACSDAITASNALSEQYKQCQKDKASGQTVVPKTTAKKPYEITLCCTREQWKDKTSDCYKTLQKVKTDMKFNISVDVDSETITVDTNGKITSIAIIDGEAYDSIKLTCPDGGTTPVVNPDKTNTTECKQLLLTTQNAITTAQKYTACTISACVYDIYKNLDNARANWEDSYATCDPEKKNTAWAKTNNDLASTRSTVYAKMQELVKREKTPTTNVTQALLDDTKADYQNQCVSPGKTQTPICVKMYNMIKDIQAKLNLKAT